MQPGGRDKACGIFIPDPVYWPTYIYFLPSSKAAQASGLRFMLLPSLVTNYMILGKLFNLLCLSFLICEVGIFIIPNSGEGYMS